MSAAYMVVMSTITRKKHTGEPGNPGQFGTTPQSAPGVTLADALPESMREVNRELRGHDFYPHDALSWPQIYATEDLGVQDKHVVAHYFSGNADWYIVEFNPESAEAFGYADLGLGFGEWGYISMSELETTVVNGPVLNYIERDLHFEPGTARDIIPRYKNQAEQES